MCDYFSIYPFLTIYPEESGRDHEQQLLEALVISTMRPCFRWICSGSPKLFDALRFLRSHLQQLHCHRLLEVLVVVSYLRGQCLKTLKAEIFHDSSLHSLLPLLRPFHSEKVGNLENSP